MYDAKLHCATDGSVRQAFHPYDFEPATASAEGSTANILPTRHADKKMFYITIF
jgi:hypothetical protein